MIKPSMVHKFDKGDTRDGYEEEEASKASIFESNKADKTTVRAINDAIFRDIDVSKVEHPNFYAILPADIRYNEKLSYFERILYAEVSALSNEKGFCYATNYYFAKRFNISVRTISRAIQSLVDEQLIYSTFEQVGKSIFRKIYLDRRDVRRPFPMENLTSDQVDKLISMGYERHEIKALVEEGKAAREIAEAEFAAKLEAAPSRDSVERIIEEGHILHVPDIYLDMAYMLTETGDYEKVSIYSSVYQEWVGQVGETEAQRIDSLCSDRRIEPHLATEGAVSQGGGQKCLPSPKLSGVDKDVYNNSTKSTVSTNSTKNTSTKSTKSTPSTLSTPPAEEAEPLQESKLELPSWLGRTPELRLARLYETLYEHCYKHPVKLKLIGVERKYLNKILAGRSEMIAGLATILHFEWRGMSGEDGLTHKRLFEAGFPLSWLARDISKYETFIHSKMEIDSDEVAATQVNSAIDKVVEMLGYRLQNDD